MDAPAPATALRSGTPDPPTGSGLALLWNVYLRTSWRRVKALAQSSRLMLAVIVSFIAGYLWLAFWLFRFGLRFLEKFPPLGTLLTERLLYLLFFFLFVLLLLSNLVIAYSNFFRNRESHFLLTLPVRAQVVFQWKLIESAVLASWAFLFLIAPLIAAFGMSRGVAWHFYPMTVLMVAVFITLPAVLGSFLAVQLGRFMDRRLFQIIGAAAVIALIAVGAFWLKPEPIPEDLEDTRVLAVLDKMLFKTQFAQWPIWPSQWLAQSVLLWAEGAWRGAFFYQLVLLSYALMFTTLAFVGMGSMFYEAGSAAQSRGKVFAHWLGSRSRARPRPTPRFRGSFLERALARLPLPADSRALIVKDLRMFWRDTTQWAQSLMLFGLLAVYIFNLRHFTQQLTNPFWIHLVSYLNLGACSLNLATLTTRFVYPQFSLEGKRLWIVGLAPMGMNKILRTKFWLAALTSECVTLLLIVASCHMLKMPWLKMAYFATAVTVMTFTLTGLAVGLGALYPNFKEENPSKIVSGFGGTFCLVMSFLYILGSVMLLAMAGPWTNPASLERAAAGYTGFLLLSLLLGLLPYRLGLRRYHKFEL